MHERLGIMPWRRNKDCAWSNSRRSLHVEKLKPRLNIDNS